MASDDESVVSNDEHHSNMNLIIYFRNLNLSYFVREPRRMLSDHFKLKDLCLENGNTDAHYIEGILKYFINDDKHRGLYHLHKSAKADYADGIYLYGVLLSARGHYLKGLKYLDMLKWEENISTSNQCWERIKHSLRSIPVPRKQLYYISMVNIEPRGNCNLDDMNQVCKECYQYKRVKLFYNIANDIL